MNGDTQEQDVEAPLIRRETKVQFAESPEEEVEDVEDPVMQDDKRARAKIMYKRMMSNPRDELRQFRSGLSWLGLDQSTTPKVIWSRILFLVFTFMVPMFNYTYVYCKDCDEGHQHPFEKLVQLSESLLAAISFLCLSHILHTFGLRRTLLLDKIVKEPIQVQQGYESELRSAFSLLGWILLPTFVVEVLHRGWWYAYVTVSIPSVAEIPKINMVLCTAAALSWFYRTSVFLFMCVLFRLMCSLQVLRLEGYNKLLEVTSEVSIILKEHMKIRSQLTTISHRFRFFMVLALFSIVFSQLTSLFQILLFAKTINFFRAGDLAVCSLVQLTGLVLCLKGAAKITHKAQRIVAIVSKWHALATCTPSALNDRSSQGSGLTYGPAHPHLNRGSSSEDLEASGREWNSLEEELAHDLEAYQKRQALVTYLQHARAGVSLYGFVLDRGFLYMIFGVAFSSTLFILGKTII